MSRPKSRRELYSESTRAALIETARAMFAERGFAQTSLDDIAAATQVTRGAVYHHFESKQALFEVVYTLLEEQMIARVLTAATAAGEDPWRAAMAGLGAFLDQCEEAAYGRLCWQEGPVALGWTRWMEIEEKFVYGLTAGFLTQLMTAGLLAPLPITTATQIVVNALGGAGRAISAAPDSERHAVRMECADLLQRMIEGLRAR